jgi:hypothetical protein
MLIATAEVNNSKDARRCCNQPASERTTATQTHLAINIDTGQSSEDRRNVSNSRELSNNRDASNSSRDVGAGCIHPFVIKIFLKIHFSLLFALPQNCAFTSSQIIKREV